MYKNIFQDFLKKKIINIKTNMMYRLKFNIIGKKIYMYIYISILLKLKYLLIHFGNMDKSIN